MKENKKVAFYGVGQYTRILLEQEYDFQVVGLMDSKMTGQIVYGKKVLSDDDDELWEFSSNKPIYFWIAKDKKSKHPFIAKIFIKDTPLGELTAHTTKITIEE